MRDAALARCGLVSLVALLGGAASAGAVGCAPHAAARSGVPSDAVASNLAAPPGSAPAEACTPTGPELCFNAVDDNCNGVIDEGCGLQTGLLQFTIAWAATAADVNLAVVTPAQERVPGAHDRSTPSGFHLDRDCPGDDACRGQNVENIYFEGQEPPHGHYVVEISLVDLHGAEAPLTVHFGARLVGRTVTFDVSLAPGDGAKQTFAFDLS